MKRLTSCAFGLAALCVTALPAGAQDLLGSSRSEIRALLPQGATPLQEAQDSRTLDYRDLRIGDVDWQNVTLHFDSSDRLTSMSMATRDLDYDGLKMRALAQYKAYVATKAAAMTIGGKPPATMQIRLCEKSDGVVEMTFEPLSADL